MKKVVLSCKKCGAELTRPLTPIRSGEEIQRLCGLDQMEGTPVPQGYALFLTGGIQIDCGQGWSRELSPDVLLNLDDVAQDVAITDDYSRTNGCCGLDGCDGPNRVCTCGADVGTERSDCWTWQLFIVAQENTEWKVQ